MLVPSTDSPHKLVQKQPDKKKPCGFFIFMKQISTSFHPPFIERVTAWRSQTLGARALIGGCRGAKQQGRRSHAACMEEQEWQVGKNNTIVVLQNSEPIEKHTLLTLELEDEEEEEEKDQSRPAKKAKK